jgi:hypothetical protein
MKRFILFLLVCLISFRSQNQVPNPDVVLELEKVSLQLKNVWRQKVMDSNIYTKMSDYQKSLTTVYETSDFLNATRSILELLTLIDMYACRIRSLHELINGEYDIPAGCNFGFKYQKAIVAFNMSLDFVDIIMNMTQMSIKDRMVKLQSAKEKLKQSEEIVSSLQLDIIYFNS